MDELVNVLVSSQHRLILPESLILLRDRATCVRVLALHAVLSIFRGLHVPEEPQNVGVVAAGSSQFVQLPGQLRRDQIRVRRVPGGTPVHRAHRVLSATLCRVAEAREHGVQT